MPADEHMTPSLARAARAILNWSMADLAQHTAVAATTIRNYESGKRGTTRANKAMIASAFLEAGIEFVAGKGKRAGLMVNKPELLNNPPPPRLHKSRQAE
jgi:transcriptional regulator with XRE-family HTH domain